jgi:uncharacterized protein
LRASRRAFGLCLFALAAAASCSRPAPAPPHGEVPGAPGGAPAEPTVVFRPAGAPEARVIVEVARTEADRQRGLMERESLKPGYGMLFIFEAPQPLTFWMYKTYISLDMIFLGADHKVVGIVEKAEPLTKDSRGVPGLSQYVVEVPAGWSASHRIAPGTPAQFVHVD